MEQLKAKTHQELATDQARYLSAQPIGQLAIRAAEACGIDSFEVQPPSMTQRQRYNEHIVLQLINRPGMSAEAATDTRLAEQLLTPGNEWALSRINLTNFGVLTDQYVPVDGSDMHLHRITLDPLEVIDQFGETPFVTERVLKAISTNLASTEYPSTVKYKLSIKEKDVEKLEPIDAKMEEVLLYLIASPGFGIEGSNVTRYLKNNLACSPKAIKKMNEQLRNRLKLIESNRNSHNKRILSDLSLTLNPEALLNNLDEKYVTEQVLQELIEGLNQQRHKLPLKPTDTTQRTPAKERQPAQHKFLKEGRRARKVKERADKPNTNGHMRFSFSVPNNSGFYKALKVKSYVGLSDCAELVLAVGNSQGVVAKGSVSAKDHLLIMLNKGHNKDQNMSPEELDELIDWAKEEGYIKGPDDALKLEEKAEEIIAPIREISSKATW